MNLQHLPAVIKQQVPTARLPVNYEVAKEAIAKCAQIDECKDWQDKSAAIASYARQIKDLSLRDSAVRIRLRAQRRIGELLLAIPAPVGQRKGERERVARDNGLGPAQATKVVQLARVEQALFDERVERSPPAPVAEIAALGVINWRGKKPGFKAGEAYLEVTAGGAATTNVASFYRWSGKRDPQALGRRMSFDEAERLRPMLQHIAAWADEFDRCLPKQK